MKLSEKEACEQLQKIRDMELKFVESEKRRQEAENRLSVMINSKKEEGVNDILAQTRSELEQLRLLLTDKENQARDWESTILSDRC